MEADKTEARKSIRSVLNVFKARISLIVRTGKVGVVGTTDKAAAGNYLCVNLSSG
jgi:hypothetical protein